MVDLNNDKENIANFLSKTVLKFSEEFSEPKSVGIYCKPSEGLFTISFNTEVEVDKDSIKSIEFEHKNFDSLLIGQWKEECKKDISQWKFLKEGGVFESSGTQKIYNINRYLTHILWTIFRQSTTTINLPTTVLSFEFEDLNSIIIHSNLEKFGRTITRLFRNENFENYLTEKEYYRNIKLEEFRKNINPNFDEQSRNLMIDKAIFYSSLSTEQIQTLDKIVLGQLDSTVFNVMRSLDENNDEQTGIKLTVDNLDVRQLPLIGNGNLSGEYFDWVERFSKFGEYQH